MAERKNSSKPKTIHSGHRERMIKKYRRLGADAFEQHELLEMLLFFSIPRHNTNETAHQLINDCRSLSNLLTTPAEKLMMTKGVGEKSTDLLRLARDTVRSAELTKSAEVPLDTFYRQTRYIQAWFRGKAPGTVMTVLLDKNKKLITTVTLAAGRRFRPEIYPPLVLEKALEANAAYVLIGHSHSNNCSEPSVEDIILTGHIRSALGSHGITLLDHYIITEYDCIPTSETPKEDENKNEEAFPLS